MIVICAGNELTGKTTFTERFAAEFNWQREKCVRIPNSNKRPEAVDNFLRNHKTTDNVIFDRWYYPDDLVYEPLFFGNKSPLLILQDIIERKLRPHNPVMLYFRADFPTMKKRFRARGDEFRTLPDIVRIELMYRKIIKTIKIPVEIINTTDLDPAETLEAGLKIIKAYGGVFE